MASGVAKSSKSETTEVARRAEELDALDTILPLDRRDQLATLLKDEDVATDLNPSNWINFCDVAL